MVAFLVGIQRLAPKLNYCGVSHKADMKQRKTVDPLNPTSFIFTHMSPPESYRNEKLDVSDWGAETEDPDGSDEDDDSDGSASVEEAAK